MGIIASLTEFQAVLNVDTHIREVRLGRVEKAKEEEDAKAIDDNKAEKTLNEDELFPPVEIHDGVVRGTTAKPKTKVRETEEEAAERRARNQQAVTEAPVVVVAKKATDEQQRRKRKDPVPVASSSATEEVHIDSAQLKEARQEERKKIEEEVRAQQRAKLQELRAAAKNDFLKTVAARQDKPTESYELEKSMKVSSSAPETAAVDHYAEIKAQMDAAAKKKEEEILRKVSLDLAAAERERKKKALEQAQKESQSSKAPRRPREFRTDFVAKSSASTSTSTPKQEVAVTNKKSLLETLSLGGWFAVAMAVFVLLSILAR